MERERGGRRRKSESINTHKLINMHVDRGAGEVNGDQQIIVTAVGVGGA